MYMQKFTQKIIVVFLMIITSLSDKNVLMQETLENWVIYREGSSASSSWGLYSIPTTGGEIVTLASKESHIDRYDITADGMVIYLDSRFANDTLFSIPIRGGEAVQLNSENHPVYSNYKISQQGNYVVYMTGNPLALYSVPVSGGTPIQLNPPETQLDFGAYYELRTTFDISPDGTFVVFTAKNARDVFQLYRTTITGGEVTQLNARLASGGAVREFLISPDSQRIVYLADQVADEVVGLFSVTLNDNQVVELFPETYGPLGFSPDSSLVALRGAKSRADEGVWVITATGEAKFLGQGHNFIFTNDNDRIVFSFGSLASSSLTNFSTNQHTTFGVEGYTLSQDGNWLLYHTATSSTDLSQVLISQHINDDTRNLLSENVGKIYNNSDYQTTWGGLATVSPDSTRVVYFENDENDIYQLYSVPISVDLRQTPELRTKLNMFPGSRRFNDQMLRITSDSSTVVYINDEEAENFVDLYSVPITGGNVIRLTPDSSEGVVDFKLYPKGTDWYTDFPRR